MIRVKKYEDEMGEQFILKFEDGTDLNINYCRNLDLYFLPKSHDDKTNFLLEIDPEEDPELFNIFFNVFNRISTYKALDGKVDKDFKKQEKYQKYPLVQNDMVVWRSDDDPAEIASKMTIYMLNGRVCMFFEEGMHQEGIPTNAVRIRTDGSRYGKFFAVFMDMYRQLCSTDFGPREFGEEEISLLLRQRNKQEE